MVNISISNKRTFCHTENPLLQKKCRIWFFFWSTWFSVWQNVPYWKLNIDHFSFRHLLKLFLLFFELKIFIPQPQCHAGTEIEVALHGRFSPLPCLRDFKWLNLSLPSSWWLRTRSTHNRARRHRDDTLNQQHWSTICRAMPVQSGRAHAGRCAVIRCGRHHYAPSGWRPPQATSDTKVRATKRSLRHHVLLVEIVDHSVRRNDGWPCPFPPDQAAVN